MFYLQVFLCFLVFLALHELGHVIAAKLMGLEIEEIGYTLKPIPHPYVSVINVETDTQRFLFLIAGPLFTLGLFISFYFLGWLQIEFVYAAIVFQLIVDANPFYSDFVFMYFNEQKDLEEFQSKIYKPYHEYVNGSAGQFGPPKEEIERLKQQAEEMPALAKKAPPVMLTLFRKIYFRPKWYVHFFIWTLYIHFLLSPHWVKSMII